MMKKLYILSLFTMLIFGGVFIVERSLSGAQEDADLSNGHEEFSAPQLDSERETFGSMNGSQHLHDSISGKLSNVELAEYYSRRAFHGAPPAIPHPVENEMSMGGKTCLQCHQNGGYVPKFEAFAPVTPHPDKINCRQCHSGALTDDLFRESNWQGDEMETPELGMQALPGSPPPIPHGTFLRGSCVSCHSGPSAAEELRMDHPERINCRQCHVPNVNGEEIKEFLKELK